MKATPRGLTHAKGPTHDTATTSTAQIPGKGTAGSRSVRASERDGGSRGPLEGKAKATLAGDKQVPLTSYGDRRALAKANRDGGSRASINGRISGSRERAPLNPTGNRPELSHGGTDRGRRGLMDDTPKTARKAPVIRQGAPG